MLRHALGHLRRSRLTSNMKHTLLLLMATAARPVIGGQAVIEGVMMRSPKSFAVAVRRRDGRIVVREDAWLAFAERFPILKWPILRGATMLIESMYNGLSALNFSAAQAMEDEELEAAGESADLGPAKEKPDEGLHQSSGKDWSLWIALGASFFFAIILFKAVPHFATWGIGNLIGNGENALPVDSALFHLVDGVIKLSIFVGYILAISLMDDVRRLFMYHGAEHMSVHTYEADAPLDVEHTRHRTTAHPRCGTTLILLVISVSILIFVAVIPLLPRVSDNDLVQTVFALFVKIPLMLPIAGIAYESQRLAAKRPDLFWVRLFIAPGMQMQKLTTRQPGDPEIEVALTALRKALWRENFVKENPDQPLRLHRSEEPQVFQDFSEVQKLVA
jgi:uncharacterized protein YqhQ